jgi:hypothetical protein
MKSVTVRHWEGLQGDVWRLDRGDKIERHKHAYRHSTGVVQGRTKVTLFKHEFGYPQSWEMDSGSHDYGFEPDMEHEIEALEDGTIVVNMSNNIMAPPGKPGKAGGLMLDTGEVIHDS